MKLFVGLDVSSDKLDACFLTDTLTILHQGSYANDIEGAIKSKKRLSICLSSLPSIKWS